MASNNTTELTLNRIQLAQLFKDSKLRDAAVIAFDNLFKNINSGGTTIVTDPGTQLAADSAANQATEALAAIEMLAINLLYAIQFANDSGQPVLDNYALPTADIPPIDVFIPPYPEAVLFVGDTGSGGKSGDVPAPAAGDAAGGKFLKADRSWAAPPGGSGGGLTSLGVATANNTSPTLTLAGLVLTTYKALFITVNLVGSVGRLVSFMGVTSTVNAGPNIKGFIWVDLGSSVATFTIIGATSATAVIASGLSTASVSVNISEAVSNLVSGTYEVFGFK